MARMYVQQSPTTAPREGDRPSPAAATHRLQRTLGNRAVARLAAASLPSDVPSTARAGVQGQGSALPYRARIQRAFGGHDVQRVQAYTGPTAAATSVALGASAYTMGDRIAFASASPSLHTVAHEAAHAVQQRAGVQLAGGVGAVGDRYERHADAVADQVVRGASAEGLLSEFTASDRGHAGAGAPGVQMAAFNRPLDPGLVNGCAIDQDQTSAQELLVNGAQPLFGAKTTRLTALLNPVQNLDTYGAPTAPGYDPLGWAWVLSNEARTRSGKLRYWVRFHLLNAKLGGDGKNIAHLVPTDKSTNSRWDGAIEEPMKDAIKGTGTLAQPNGAPIYYDVRVTYWNTGAAPGTYDLSGIAGQDFSSNIELFPQQIDAAWWTFQGNAWVSQGQVTTGPIPQPAGVGGSDVDLLSTTTNFSGLSGIYGIDNEIFDVLVRDVIPSKPQSYRDVRLVLEAWVTKAAGSTNSFVSRANKLFQADAKLRQALAGNHPLKLKLAGQHVRDDATPEARQFDSPANVKSTNFGARFDTKSFKFQINTFRSETEDPVRSGYTRASGTFTKIPRAYDVIAASFPSLLDRVRLAQIHAAWEHFIDPDNNERLPPMIDNAFANEGQEVATVVFLATIDALEKHAYQQIGYTNQPKDTDTLRKQLIDALGFGKNQGVLRKTYWDALMGHRPGAGKDYLTVEHIAGRNIPALYTLLLQNEPGLSIVQESGARVDVVRDALIKGLPINGTTFPGLTDFPWRIPLTTPIAATMRSAPGLQKK